MGSSSDFSKEMDDRLIKEPRGYWAFAPSILPQKSHGNAPESELEMDMANEELVACIRGRVDQVGGEKRNRRTEDRKERRLCQTL